MRKSQLANKLFSLSWDGKTHTYAIVEPMKLVGQVTGLDQYVFVVRRRVGQYIKTTSSSYIDQKSVDKKNKETTCYIDVKSEILRDILRDVLKDVGGVSLNESKLCVSYAHLIESRHSPRQGRAEPPLHHPSRARVMPGLERDRPSRLSGYIASGITLGLPEKRICRHDPEHALVTFHRLHHL